MQDARVETEAERSFGSAVGGLVVSLAKSTELLKTVVGVIQSVVAARPGRSVELVVGGDTLKLTGVSSEETRWLIDLFVERHAH